MSVEYGIQEQLGWIALNQPKRLNAMNLEDVIAISKALDEMEGKIDALFLFGKNGVFCAGGDVRNLIECSQKEVHQFIEKEYQLIERFYKLSYPTIAYASGVVMGGGLGLFMSAKHRFCAPGTKMAMPETLIGLYPDALSGVFLPKAGILGRFWGLFGVTIPLFEAYHQGWIHGVVPFEHQELMKTHLLSCLKEKIPFLPKKEWLLPLQSGYSSLTHAHIKKAMSVRKTSEAVNAILSLATQNQELQEAKERLERASPLAMYFSDQHFFDCKDLSLNEVCQYEIALSKQIITFGEFSVGVKALLVEKNKHPLWQYPTFGSLEQLNPPLI